MGVRDSSNRINSTCTIDVSETNLKRLSDFYHLIFFCFDDKREIDSHERVRNKGRIIRKVMGEGRGIFEPQELFFVIKFLLWIYFRP